MTYEFDTQSPSRAQEPVAITTRKGEEILVDLGTAEFIGGRAVWLAGSRRYPAIRHDGKDQPLHRLVMNAKEGEHVDHINGDKLDCRRENLRLCTHGENSRNRRMSKANASGRKGVHWRRRVGKWRAQIMLNGKHIHLGDFHCREEAAAAYDRAAAELHGEFARTNAMLSSPLDAPP